MVLNRQCNSPFVINHFREPSQERGTGFNPTASTFHPIAGNQVTQEVQDSSGSFHEDHRSFYENAQDSLHGGHGGQPGEQVPGTWGSGVFTGKVSVEYLGDYSDNDVNVRGIKCDYITCENPVQQVKPVLKAEEVRSRTGPHPARMGEDHKMTWPRMTMGAGCMC